MAGEKVLLGLIGFPLGHSKSPEWFNDRFLLDDKKNYAYRLFPINSIEEFPGLLCNEPELAGLNVTIPYKEKIIPYLDELDETAQKIGAVNTIKITRKGGLVLTKGFNTDAAGFQNTIMSLSLKGPALILGTGGGGKAVAHALRAFGIKVIFVSRKGRENGQISYTELTPGLIRSHPLIINTTPLGMYPHSSNCPPIPYHLLSAGHFLYDLIYNPPVTEFMKRGILMQAQTMNGQQMLENQAELSYRILLETM